MRGRTAPLLLALSLAAGAAACGGAGGGGGGAARDSGAQPSGSDPAAYVDAVAEGLLANEGYRPTEEQARCVAEGSIAAVGVDRLRLGAITPERLARSAGIHDVVTLTEDQARQVVGAYRDCGIPLVRGVFGFASEEQLACIEAAVDEEVLAEALVFDMIGRTIAYQQRIDELSEAYAAACSAGGG